MFAQVLFCSYWSSHRRIARHPRVLALGVLFHCNSRRADRSLYLNTCAIARVATHLNWREGNPLQTPRSPWCRLIDRYEQEAFLVKSLTHKSLRIN